MSPIRILQEWAEKYPHQASIILAGVACFAAVAVILGFNLDVESNIKNVYYVIAAGASVFLLSRMLNNDIIVSTVTWFVFILTILWIVAFIVYRSTLLDAVSQQRIACVVRFLDNCNVVADRVAKAEAPEIESKIRSAAASVPKVDTAKSLKIFVQFAGRIDRDTVRTMMRDLQSKDWAVQGTEEGGKRTSLAAGQSEVRYSGDNAAAAASLAQAVTLYGISGRPVKAVPNPDTPGDQLEVWISN
ncbi:hypothetical protein [Azospirillum doebereinerae]